MVIKADSEFERPPAITAWPDAGRGEQQSCESGDCEALSA